MSHSIDVLNRVTGPQHNRCSSYEDLIGVRPRVMSIQPWSCRAWALTPARTRSKLDPSAVEGINLGRSERQLGAYLIWVPHQLRTVSTSDATFHETLLPWRPPGQQRLDARSSTPSTATQISLRRCPPQLKPHRTATTATYSRQSSCAARPAPILAPRVGVA